MSIIETIISRAMSDEVFADALLADPEKALAEYHLPADVIEKFKNMSRADFEVLDAEERRSMSPLITGLKGQNKKPTENVSINFSEISLK
jgi:hypothetical protein